MRSSQLRVGCSVKNISTFHFLRLVSAVMIYFVSACCVNNFCYTLIFAFDEV
jgi:hypothetical protein